MSCCGRSNFELTRAVHTSRHERRAIRQRSPQVTYLYDPDQWVRVRAHCSSAEYYKTLADRVNFVLQHKLFLT